MSERSTYLLLIVLLLGQLLLIASRPEARGSRIERFTLALLAPVGHAVSATWDGVSGLAGSWRSHRALRRENRELHRRIARLRADLVRFHGIEEEIDRLSRITTYSRRSKGAFTVADVVFVDHASWLRTLVLYTGGSEARRDQPVLTPDGLVGRIILTAGRYAKVQLITDRSSSVGAMVERTRRKGVVRGVGEEGLALDFIPLQAEVRRGDRVVTAGIDGIYPRGIPIGRIERVEPGASLFHRIAVTPAIDLGVLDQVFILTVDAVPDELLERVPGGGP